MHGVDFGDDLIYDPCCGGGNILDVAKRYGHPTIGSDVIDRNPRHKFMRGNILTQIPRMPQMERRNPWLRALPMVLIAPAPGVKLMTKHAASSVIQSENDTGTA